MRQCSDVLWDSSMSGPAPYPLPAAASLRAGRHEAMLQPKVIGRAEGLPGRSWLALLLMDGAAEISDGAAREQIGAPLLIWRPWTAGDSVRLAAGTTAAHLFVGAGALFNAVGTSPDSQDLRALAERSVLAPLAGEATVLGTLQTCFDAVIRETAAARPAAATLVEAYLRILLIELWRLRQGPDFGAVPMTHAHRAFDAFAALVEMHFRERWTVNRYAETLGLSRDRLGDICQRVNGSTPKDIIDRRAMHEARLLLQGSTYSIEQIAGLLGFQTASQFNRFVRRRAGSPPGQLRRTGGTDGARAGTGAGATDGAFMHDWP
jgi:AraC family transcriptional activator of pobA